MGVRGIPGAEDGTTFDIDAIMSAINAGDPDANAIKLATLLAQMGGQRAGSVVQPDVAGIAAEQRQRTNTEAASLHDSAQYLPMFNPGGLFDSIAGFIGNLGAGGGTPRLEDGQRLANRVQMPSMDEAAARAQSAAQNSPVVGGQGGQYDSQIQQLIAPILAKLTASSAPAFAEMNTAPEPVRPRIPSVGAMGKGVTKVFDTYNKGAEANYQNQAQAQVDRELGGANPINTASEATKSMLKAILERITPRVPKGIY